MVTLIVGQGAVVGAVLRRVVIPTVIVIQKVRDTRIVQAPNGVDAE
ncbi:hypothetical protein CLV51_1021234 [Chitinophaga niastensis]|uniref:Uncharacterized protein n=1 Tax=Chitinophaga niastensis TaxID=536980 RepID=A0A2P8HQ86_CHINA|nr:hypothetical protein CLV51_1021234 [Chitinophaga niastensis]